MRADGLTASLAGEDGRQWAIATSCKLLPSVKLRLTFLADFFPADPRPWGMWKHRGLGITLAVLTELSAESVKHLYECCEGVTGCVAFAGLGRISMFAWLFLTIVPTMADSAAYLDESMNEFFSQQGAKLNKGVRCSSPFVTCAMAVPLV